MGELLSVAQWAERYGKDERNARRLIAEGRLAAVRIGGRSTATPSRRRTRALKAANTGTGEKSQ